MDGAGKLAGVAGLDVAGGVAGLTGNGTGKVEPRTDPLVAVMIDAFVILV